MTNYPAQIDNGSTLPIVSSNVTPGSIFNKLRDAVIAIETELGIKPSGINTTVRARLDYLEFLFGNLQPVQIGGDLGGTTSSPIVIGIQGNPISNITPALNDVLTWNGIAWEPKANSGGGGTGTGQQGSPGVTGAQGPQGSPGATGTQGSQGPQGSPGVTGTIGPQGQQGSPGVTGTQGPQGSPGINGAGGNSGVYVYSESATLGLFKSLNFHGPGVSASATGTLADIYIVVSASGTQGPQGSPGVTGTQGPQGSPGVTGTQGNQGSPGVTGAQGQQGSPGATGIQGNQGSPGVTGTQGSQGSPGVTGTQGPQGSPGVTGTQGNQGSPGVTGTQGIQGSPGVTGTQGVQGSPGVTGTQGAQGSPGVTGTQGQQGSPGVTGTQGPQGSPGVTGTQGPQGSPGVTGTQGLQGSPGVTGLQGAQGFQGSPGMNTNRYIIPDALTTFAWPLDGPTGSTSFANIATGMSAAMNIPTGGTNFTAGRAGLFNEALRLQNPGWVRTTFENDLNISPTSFTMSCWIRPKALQTGSNWGRILTKWFNKNYTTVAPDAFAIVLNNLDNIVYVSCNNGGASKETSKISANVPILNQWNHVVVTYNAGTVSIWLNGNLTLVDTTFPATINFNGVTGGAWSIGGTPTSTTYLTDTEIDDVRVDSGTVRGATYILNMFQAGAYGNGGVLTGIQGSPGVTGPQGPPGAQGSPGISPNRYTAIDTLNTFVWPLDGPTGSTSFDNISTGVSGALNIATGGANFVAGRQGVFDQALRIQAGAWVRTTFTDALHVSTTQLSVYGWIRPLANQAVTTFGRIISKWANTSLSGAAPDTFALVLQQNSVQVYIQASNAGVNKATTPSAATTLLLNQWNFVAATYNAGVVNLYINGNNVLTDSSFPATLSMNGASGGPWSIGGGPGAGNVNNITDAELDDWRVDSGTVRTATFLTALMQNALLGFGGQVTGPTGAQGPQGSPGVTGTQGPQGSPGVTGTQGIQGVQGSPGVTGTSPFANGLLLRVKNINQPTYTVAVPDYSLNVNTGSPVSIIFSSATSMGTGYVFCIVDDTFNADNNPISITPVAADLLDNATGVSSLITKGGAWTYQSNGANKWKRLS